MGKESIERKIRALLAKTPENGATEEESLLAASKARELMDRYQISLGEEIKEEGCILTKSPWGPIEVVKRLSNACSGIEALTDTFIVLSGPSQTRHRIEVIGLPSDVELAIYLWDVCINHEKIAWEKYKKSEQYKLLRSMKRNGKPMSPKAIRRSLTVAFANRIGERMQELAELRNCQFETAKTGTDLVIIKNQIIEKGKEIFNLNDLAPSREIDFGVIGPDRAGRVAAEKVNLQNPIKSETVIKINS